MAGPRDYLPSDVKRLFALSKNQCAMPGCSTPIISSDGCTVLGEICHIEAASKEGLRWNKDMTDDERRRFDNLILLCSNHHKEIDNRSTPDLYTVEKLKEIKLNHNNESFLEEYEISDTEAQSIIKHTGEVLHTLDYHGEKLDSIKGTVNKTDEAIQKLIELVVNDSTISIDEYIFDKIKIGYTKDKVISILGHPDEKEGCSYIYRKKEAILELRIEDDSVYTIVLILTHDSPVQSFDLGNFNFDLNFGVCTYEEILNEIKLCENWYKIEYRQHLRCSHLILNTKHFLGGVHRYYTFGVLYPLYPYSLKEREDFIPSNEQPTEIEINNISPNWLAVSRIDGEDGLSPETLAYE